MADSGSGSGSENTLNRIYDHFTNGYEVTQVKKDLENWKYILLPLNNLLEWKHKFDPLIIVGIVTFIFGFLWIWSPSLLTTVALICIVALVFDFAVPIITQNFLKSAEWTSSSEAKYTRICERVSNFYSHLIKLRQRLVELRKEKHSLYFIIVFFFLVFCVYVGQQVDNLLLSYLAVLTLALIPGARRHNLPDKALDFIKSFIKKPAATATLKKD